MPGAGAGGTLVIQTAEQIEARRAKIPYVPFDIEKDRKDKEIKS